MNPEDDRYSTLEYAMSRVSDNNNTDIFVNCGTHTERYVHDKNTAIIVISETQKIKTIKI